MNLISTELDLKRRIVELDGENAELRRQLNAAKQRNDELWTWCSEVIVRSAIAIRKALANR